MVGAKPLPERQSRQLQYLAVLRQLIPMFPACSLQAQISPHSRTPVRADQSAWPPLRI